MKYFEVLNFFIFFIRNIKNIYSYFKC